MSTIQTKLDRKTAALRRKLFDNSISLMGQELKCVRLKTAKNIYGDVETLVVINDDVVTAVIKIPSDIPFSRLRGDVVDEVNDSSTVFFYDILPIDIYSQWADNIEKDDILIFEIFDEKDEPLQIILKVSDSVTKFKQSIVWKRSLGAPYNGDKTFLADYLI